MSESESNIPDFIDVSDGKAEAWERDQDFEREGVSLLKVEMENVLALAKTPEDAKALVRQVLLEYADGRQFTDPNITWNIEGKKIFITAEAQILIFDVQHKSKQIKVMARQVIDIKEKGKKKKDVLSRYIN